MADRNPRWPFPEERDDPLARARHIACVLLAHRGDALALAARAAEEGEPWLLEWLQRDEGALADVIPLRRSE